MSAVAGIDITESSTLTAPSAGYQGAASTTFVAGNRVRFVGFTGACNGPIGTVSMMVWAKSAQPGDPPIGVLIRWDHDRKFPELVHPDALRLLTEPATSRNWQATR